MPNRSGDWFKQAERDLEQAEESRASGRHEWACFAAHQAAEKAVKAVHLHHRQEAWGHSIKKLLEDLPEIIKVSEDLLEKANVLDGFYIPPRYPNSHPQGAPFEHFGILQSNMAITYAREILQFARSQMA
jgi:HEPN domain-containing protein